MYKKNTNLMILSINHHPLLLPATPGSEDGTQAGKTSPTTASGGGSSRSGGFAASLNSVSMILGGEEASRWGKAGGADAGDQREPPRLAYLRAKSAAKRCGGGVHARETCVVVD